MLYSDKRRELCEMKKIIPLIYIKDLKAYKDKACKEAYDMEVLDLVEKYEVAGADEIALYDLSYDDASHDAFIGLVRQIANSIDVAMIVGGRVLRTEDVKKYLYAGAKASFLCADDENSMALRTEVSDRFGYEKVYVFDEKGEVSFEKNKTMTLKDTTDENAVQVYEDLGFDIYELKSSLRAQGIEVNIFESNIDFSEFKLLDNGLIPVIVQDYKTDEVLMLAYMNKVSFEQTIRTGVMTYYSRSRQELWVKGETSGHYQYLKSMSIDCDNDTLLAKVKQIGAACHTGNRSCFYRELAAKEYSNTNPLKVFDKVMDTILDRKKNPKEGSYTNYLFDKGIDKILKKCGEECTEIVIAAKNPDKEEIKYEIADFLYHVMVLMAVKDVSWDEIITELDRR